MPEPHNKRSSLFGDDNNEEEEEKYREKLKIRQGNAMIKSNSMKKFMVSN